MMAFDDQNQFDDQWLISNLNIDGGSAEGFYWLTLFSQTLHLQIFSPEGYKSFIWDGYSRTLLADGMPVDDVRAYDFATCVDAIVKDIDKGMGRVRPLSFSAQFARMFSLQHDYSFGEAMSHFCHRLQGMDMDLDEPKVLISVRNHIRDMQISSMFSY